MKSSPIYKAQCYGNVEPIEYMVPYPNLRSLAVGQCIKFADSILFKDSGMTNGAFLKSINKTANWLVELGIEKCDKVFIKIITSPMREILSYAIWSLGAVLAIAGEEEQNQAIKETNPALVIDSISEKRKKIIDEQSENYLETDNTLLLDSAVIYFHEGKGIQLSHYNLLINTYGIQKHLNILHKDTLQIDVSIDTSAGLVLKTILPLYSGASVSDDSANITMDTTGNANYHIKFDWKDIKDTTPQSLYVLPEATAILSIGKTPNHVLSIASEGKMLKINGHSVMMGYMVTKENNKVFHSGSLVIHK